MLSLAGPDAPRPAIVTTVATIDQGVPELLAAVEAFRARAEQSGLLARKRRDHLRRQFEDTLQDRLRRRVEERVLGREDRERMVDRLAARELDPFAAVDEVLGRMGL
jgi:putative protein kinase ArgK-like GTPase of G3E family